MWFKREKNVIESDSDAIKSIRTRLNRIEAEILDIATAQDIIRNKVLRKIQYRKDSTDQEDQDTDIFGFPITKDLNIPEPKAKK